MLWIITTIALTISSALLGYLYLENKKKAPLGYTETDFNKKVKEKTKEIKEDKQSQLDDYKKELKERFREKEGDLKEQAEMKNSLELDRLKLKLQEKNQKEEEIMREKVLELQVEVNRKEDELNDKLEGINDLKEDLNQERSELLDKENELNKEKSGLAEKIRQSLEKVAKLSTKDARKELKENVHEEMGEDLLIWQKKALQSAKDTVNKKAREIVSLAIQRCSSEVANEVTVTNVKLNSDDEKGKIIGKGGRNIQWLEKTLGVEIVIDETPEVVTVSGFSSIRRHIAKRTLEKLLEDGRIHPGSIEDMYTKAKAELSQDIEEAGRWAVEALGIYDFPDKLIRIIGRLKFRTSYGQNMLTHSVEMARLAGILAKDLNQQFPANPPIEVDMCIKGALLHDIGKAIDEETVGGKGDHVTLGEKVCDTFGLNWKIKKCVSSHHNEEYEDAEKGMCLEAVIVDACDNISGSRPGGRKESVEAYTQRVEALEKIAENIPGINKAWVMRGSRELWVFFDTKKTTPAQMHKLVKLISEQIQTDVTYPGEIKIIGMWEDKAIAYAH